MAHVAAAMAHIAALTVSPTAVEVVVAGLHGVARAADVEVEVVDCRVVRLLAAGDGALLVEVDCGVLVDDGAVRAKLNKKEGRLTITAARMPVEVGAGPGGKVCWLHAHFAPTSRACRAASCISH
jgi:hypothetical protein